MHSLMKRAILLIVALGLLLPFKVFAAKAADKSGAAYENARICYKDLTGINRQTATIEEWDLCIAEFEKIKAKYPKGEKADAALFSAGRLRQELYGVEKRQEDLDGSIRLFNQLVRDYPKSQFADDSLYRIACIRRDFLGQMDRARHAFKYIVANYPDGDMFQRAKDDLAALGDDTYAEGSGGATVQSEAETKSGPAPAAPVPVPSAPTAPRAPASAADAPATPVPEKMTTADAFGRAQLSAIDVSTTNEITSVLFIIDRPIDYSVEYTEQGTRTQSPPKLDIILLHTTITPDLERDKAVNSAHLAGFEVKKRILGSGVKAVFTLVPGSDYDISRDGTKIKIRFGKKGELKKEPASGSKKRSAFGKVHSPSNLNIVIDPGHGGSDTGAVGPNKTLEKNITLAVSKRLADELETQTGAQIFLTRSDDRTLSLEDRDAVAVAKKADLFISIHANAANEKSQSGFETYYLNNATDEAAAKLAKRENKAAKKKLSTVEHILSTMLQNDDTEESRKLAKQVQSTLSKRIASSNKKAHDRGVRSAMFYVLVGAKCPAILVETSFISNPHEEKLLKSGQYQKELASAVTEGVQKYIKNSEKAYVKK